MSKWKIISEKSPITLPSIKRVGHPQNPLWFFHFCKIFNMAGNSRIDHSPLSLLHTSYLHHAKSQPAAEGSLVSRATTTHQAPTKHVSLSVLQNKTKFRLSFPSYTHKQVKKIETVVLYVTQTRRSSRKAAWLGREPWA